MHLWIHLLISANHADGKTMIGNQSVLVPRGSLATGRISLARDTKINQSKIERLLKLFEREKQIEQQTFSKYRLISITNYDLYQSGEQQVNSKRTASEQQVNTNNKNNNDNKDSQRLFSDDDLEIANTIYSKILSIDSKAKKPNFNKWADDIRLMRERDNRTPEEIKSVFEFANKDAFWKSNILSPAKLRAKFTTLLAQKQRSGNKDDSKPFDPYENYL